VQISRSSLQVATAAACLAPSSLGRWAFDLASVLASIPASGRLSRQLLASVLASTTASGRLTRQLLAAASYRSSSASYSTFATAWPAFKDCSTNSTHSCSFAASSGSSEPSAASGPFEGSTDSSTAVTVACPSVPSSASEAYLATSFEGSEPSIAP